MPLPNTTLQCVEGDTAEFGWKYNKSLGLPIGIAIIKAGIPPETLLTKLGDNEAQVKHGRTSFLENCGMKLTDTTLGDVGDYEVRVIFADDQDNLYHRVHLDILGKTIEASSVHIWNIYINVVYLYIVNYMMVCLHLYINICLIYIYTFFKII